MMKNLKTPHPNPLPQREREFERVCDLNPSPLAGEGGARTASAVWEGEGASPTQVIGR